MENLDFEKAMGMMSMLSGDKKDMMGMLDMFMPPKKQRQYNKDSLYEKAYDEGTDIRCLKTSVPYLQYNHQKNILLMIKMMEIQKLFEIYNTNERKDCTKDDMMGLLEELVPHLDGANKEQIKKCLDMHSIIERLGVNERN